ncbi:hypothetical protein Vadar_013104 [Vaccinium darrowii]|uniref:Uncharacterized protein n=1 Tax=Vaccinium darrowii TaxID=229202 RepID=A0ACB7X073_9ERIC|nr:hypothetical protein Vadar_013104 [Vaccinium darrowii]
MAAAKSKGKEKVIATNKRKYNACPVVGYLREKNVGVVIREEQANVIRSARDTEMAEANSKGKEKVISASKGKENAFPVGANENTISKATLAQRNRRERESIEKNRPGYQSGQRLRRERDRALSCIQPRHPTFFPSLTSIRRATVEQRVAISEVPNEQHVVTHPSTHLISTLNTSMVVHDSDNEVQNTPVEVDAIAHVSSSRHFLGEMSTTCSSCGALHWMDEKLAHSSKKNPCFGTCCLQGKVKLPPLMTPPSTNPIIV